MNEELSRIDINGVTYYLLDENTKATAVTQGRYNPSNQRIELLNANNNVVSFIDATNFIKDGMVSNVSIVNGNLVITFNTDAGKSPISIPLTSIFNPSNYYQKSEIDSKLAEKQSEISNLESKIGYYECSSEASSASKTIASSNYVLGNGGSIKVKMTNANTADNATLNINSTGAKPLYYGGVRVSSSNSWDAGETVEVYYDGTSYYANNVKGGSGSGVYDVSKEHPTSGSNSDGKFTLEYILNSGNVNELIPVNKRYPGMTIQFVSTSDNKYIQARLMAQNFTTDVSQWQGVDDEPTAGSENLVKGDGIYYGLNYYSQYKNRDFIVNIWVNSSKQLNKDGYSYLVAVKEGDIISIKRNSNNNSRLAYIKNNAVVGELITLAAGLQQLTVPSNVDYILVCKNYRQTDYSPEIFSVNGMNILKPIEDEILEGIAGINEELGDIKNNVSLLDSYITGIIDNLYIFSSYIARNFGSCLVYKVKPEQNIQITGANFVNYVGRAAFVSGIEGELSAIGSILEIPRNDTITATVPSSANYLIINKVYYSTNVDYTPSLIFIDWKLAEPYLFSEINNTNIRLNKVYSDFYGHYIGLAHVWVSGGGGIGNDGYSKVYYVKSGDTIKIKAGSNFARVFFSADYNDNPYKIGSHTQIAANTTETLVAPLGANYIYVSESYNSSSYRPAEFVINDGIEAPFELYGKKICLKYIHSENKVIAYVRIGETDTFLAYNIELCNDTSEIVYQYLWRLKECNIVKYDKSSGAFENVLSSILYGSENEFAFKYEGRYDFTGGFHGDERIDIAPECYIKFIANGFPIDSSKFSSDFTMWCNTFSYIQYSSLHATTPDGTTPVENHPIIGYHFKETVFDESVKIKNIVRFTESLHITVYFSGLVCVGKKAATSCVISENIIDINARDNSTHVSNDTSATEVCFWNGGYKCGVSVDSKVNRKNFEQDFSYLMQVQDRAADSKYYRFLGTFDVVNNNIIETECMIKIKY